MMDTSSYEILEYSLLDAFCMLEILLLLHQCDHYAVGEPIIVRSPPKNPPSEASGNLTHWGSLKCLKKKRTYASTSNRMFLKYVVYDWSPSTHEFCFQYFACYVKSHVWWLSQRTSWSLWKDNQVMINVLLLDLLKWSLQCLISTWGTSRNCHFHGWKPPKYKITSGSFEVQL